MSCGSLFVVWCSLFGVSCSLGIVCRLLFVVCCRALCSVDVRWLVAVCCVMFDVCVVVCLWLFVCCLRVGFIYLCLLAVCCCLLFVFFFFFFCFLVVVCCLPLVERVVCFMRLDSSLFILGCRFLCLVS